MEEQVNWGRQFTSQMYGTDFRRLEYRPLETARYSHKFKGPGLRYEVAITIATGYIVHINGPFRCGEWSDLRIARSYLHSYLPTGEGYIADRGYRDRYGPSLTRDEISAEDRPKVNALLARHETINRRFKQWSVLSERFRHSENLYGPIFAAIAIITQIEIENGAHVWDI